jgi:hypothetical protein
VFDTPGQTEANVHVGVWGGFKGTIWVGDWWVEELILVNVLRHDACPLVAKAADGGTVFEEG